MTSGDVIIAAVGLVGGGIATYVGLRLVPIEQHLAERKDARKQEAEALERRLTGLHDGVQRAYENLDRRMSQMEQTYISRLELERTINAVGERMDRGVARVEAAMKEMGSKVESLADRVTRVEAA
jgi:hypothetical protein